MTYQLIEWMSSAADAFKKGCHNLLSLSRNECIFVVFEGTIGMTIRIIACDTNLWWRVMTCCHTVCSGPRRCHVNNFWGYTWAMGNKSFEGMLSLWWAAILDLTFLVDKKKSRDTCSCMILNLINPKDAFVSTYKPAVWNAGIWLLQK